MRALPILLICLGLLPMAPTAQAGAWPREKGTWFVAGATRVAWPQDMRTWTSLEPTEDYQTLYVEYGLTPDWTLGLDLGRSVSGGNKTIAFAQYPLRNRDSGPKVALQFGLGEVAGDTVLRPGLLVGWGLKNGWLTFDTLAEVHTDGGTDLKMDATYGRNLPGDRKLILQLQTGLQHDDAPFARFAPSLVSPMDNVLTRKIDARISTEVGATWGLTGDASMGLKMGFWLEF